MKEDLSKFESTCQYCGKTIKKYQSNIVKGKLYYFKCKINKFCSQDCFKLSKGRNIGGSELIDTICNFCKKPIKKEKYRFQLNKNYCSRYCAGKVNQACKTVKSWTFVKKKTRTRIKTINYKLCYYCDLPVSGKFCKKCLLDKENIRAKNRYSLKQNIPYICKKELVDLFGGCCIKCGYNKCQAALCFHHIDTSTKSFTLDASNMMKKSWNQILEESKKCELLCSNCHSIHHEQDRSISTLHNSRRLKQTKIRQKLIDYKNNKCNNCGLQSEYTQVYNFHHRLVKNFPLDCKAFVSKNIDELYKEADLCDLLCSNCHFEHHHPNKQLITNINNIIIIGFLPS